MAWYRVGTVNVTNNANTITGVGTTWVQATAIGETFLGPDSQLYEITEVNSNTSLKINPAYKGPTSTAQNYAVMPTQGYLRDLAAQAAALVASYAAVRDGAGAGKFAAGTVAAPSVRGAADEDTGFRFPGSNIIELITGGTVKMTVAADGTPSGAFVTKFPVSPATQAALDALAQSSQTALNALAEACVAIANIGSAPNEIPSNQHLGQLAFLDTVGGMQMQRHTPDAKAGDFWVEQTTATPALKFNDPADGQTKNLFDILIRDPYRATVEAGSGGKQTVLYTAKGQPSVMNIIPAFNLEDIDASLGTGLHPMFVVGGVAKRERFIGAYLGSVVNGELVSLPGVDPAASRSFDSFVTTARSNGAGWGLMTNADWAGIALWCWKNGFMPRGNTDYGRAHDAKYEVGRRMDSGLPGVTTGTPRTLTGSGPSTWNHDNTPSGIADLCGNVWECAPGARLLNSELHLIADNDAALVATDLSSASALWKAVHGETGELVAPGHASAVKYATSGSANYTLVRGAGGSFEGITNPGTSPVSTAALQVLKKFGLFPVSSNHGTDGIWLSSTEERVLFRGGNWSHGTAAGLSATALNTLRSATNQNLGARPAYTL